MRRKDREIADIETIEKIIQMPNICIWVCLMMNTLMLCRCITVTE